MCKDAWLCQPKCCIKKLLKIKNLLCFCAAAKKRTDSFQNPSAFITHRIYPASREKSSFAKFAVLYAKIT